MRPTWRLSTGEPWHTGALTRYSRLTELDEALEDVERALDLDPGHAAAAEEKLKVKALLKSKKPKMSIEKLMAKKLVQPACLPQRRRLEGKRGKCVAMTRALLDLLGSLVGRPLYTEQDYVCY